MSKGNGLNGPRFPIASASLFDSGSVEAFDLGFGQRLLVAKLFLDRRQVLLQQLRDLAWRYPGSRFLRQCPTFAHAKQPFVNATLVRQCHTCCPRSRKSAIIARKWDIEKSAIYKDVPRRRATCVERNKKRFLLPRWWVIIATGQHRLHR